MKMAQDRVEERLQALAGRANSGTAEGGGESVNSVGLTPALLSDKECGLWLGVESEEGWP